MSRGRVAAGLAVACVGTAVWFDAVAAPLATLTDAIPYALLVLAAVAGLRALRPPVSLVGPGLLLLIGAGWLAVRHDLVGRQNLVPAAAAALVVGGWVVALSPSRPRWRPRLTHRVLTAFLPRRFEPTGEAPPRLAVTVAFGGGVTVDLRGATFPSGVNAMEIDVTSLGGWVDIRLPEDWTIGPGRIVERGVRLTGTMGWVVPALQPNDLPAEIRTGLPVVLNVLALRGAVSVPDRLRQEGPPRPS